MLHIFLSRWCNSCWYPFPGAPCFSTPFLRYLFFRKTSQDSFMNFLLTLEFVCIIIPLHHKCFCMISWSFLLKAAVSEWWQKTSIFFWITIRITVFNSRKYECSLWVRPNQLCTGLEGVTAVELDSSHAWDKNLRLEKTDSLYLWFSISLYFYNSFFAPVCIPSQLFCWGCTSMPIIFSLSLLHQRVPGQYTQRSPWQQLQDLG